MWLTTYFVYLIKTRGLFMVNDGNDDKDLLHDPANYKLDNALNVYFTGFEDTTEQLGGWFISPERVEAGFCSKESCSSDLFKSPQLSKTDTVFLLLHGNAKNRGASHRIAAYKTFQSLGFYTLTIDYRGYGDSTRVGELTETSVVEDAMMAIRELRGSLGSEFKLVLYGHSMGSGISTHAAFLAQEEGIKVDGIILDSPLHSFGWGLARSSIIAFIDRFIGIESVLEEHDILFNSIHWLKKIRAPVRILHADVDKVIPVEQSIDLVKDCKQIGKTNINLVRFTEEGLGHIGISTTKGFREQIRDFAELVG